MARCLADGSIQLSDGRVIFANNLVLAADLCEIIPLFTPPPAWPFIGGGGGGGGGAGTPGARGADGAPGAPGTQGPQGTNPGPQGNQGNQGNQGVMGAGFQGPQGDAGEDGIQGAQGNQGNQGNQGAIGAGFQGPQGDAGADGNQGSQGNQGFQGFQGSVGDAGGDVVAAEQVVASTREDEPLTQAGLVAAIAALPASGGHIYLGAGTLALTSTVVIDKNVKLIGAGINATLITVASGVVAFSVGDFGFIASDLEVSGNSSVGQTFILNTAPSGETIFITKVHVHDMEIIFDNNNLGHEVKITDSLLSASGATPFVLLDGPSQTWFIENSQVTGEIDAPTTIFIVANSTLTVGTATNLSLGNSSKFAGCTISAVTITFGLDCQITGCRIQGDITPANLCRFANCSIENDIIAGGLQISVIGCNIETFTSVGFSKHTIIGNVFEGGGANVILTDCSSCVVKGNIDCQVTESGTSDNNKYAEISTASTLTGASSVVTDADKYAWSSPGTLTTTDNALFARPSPQVSTMIRLLEVNVETAPTGAAIEVDFRVGTKATGALGAVIGTVTVAIGAFTGNTTVSPAVVLLPTQFIVVEITQVGSTIAGANATMTARA